MADYNNENQHESAEQFEEPAQQQPEQIDEGNQETSGDGGPVTDDNYFGAPQGDSAEGVGIPKNYEGGEQGEYTTGDGQQQQTDSADGDVPPAQEEQKYEDNASAPGYDGKSAVGDTDGTGSFDQPTSDQTQLGTDETTNGSYDAGTQPPVGETAAPPPPPAETPKKEGLITKLKEKLPGHHKSTDDPATADEDETTGGTPPKQGLVSKIKEKIHI
jgi:hypothetical protein